MNPGHTITLCARLSTTVRGGIQYVPNPRRCLLLIIIITTAAQALVVLIELLMLILIACTVYAQRI